MSGRAAGGPDADGSSDRKGSSGTNTSEAYSKSRGGRLKLKGVELKYEPAPSKHSSSSSSSSSKKRDKEAAEAGGKVAEGDDAFELIQCTGTGRLVTSGSTVYGQETKFLEQLAAGDAVIVEHPTSMQEETRIVKMILSNTSMALSSAFSSDLVTGAKFTFVKRPKEDTGDAEAVAKRQRKKQADDDEKLAFGTYAGAQGTQFTYRVKKSGAYGGYAILSAPTDRPMTREELLNMRSKKKSDRLCM